MTRQTTNVKDRYQAWRSDPQTSDHPTLASAFLEGFTQAVEAVTGQMRSDSGVTSDEVSEGWELLCWKKLSCLLNGCSTSSSSRSSR